jgi:hypothetical protein
MVAKALQARDVQANARADSVRLSTASARPWQARGKPCHYDAARDSVGLWPPCDGYACWPALVAGVGCELAGSTMRGWLAGLYSAATSAARRVRQARWLM